MSDHLTQRARFVAAWEVFSKRHGEARTHTYGCPSAHNGKTRLFASCNCGLSEMLKIIKEISSVPASSEHYGPAAIVTDKTDLSKIDPVKIAEKSLHAALQRLNRLLYEGKIPPDDQDFIFDRICDVLDQLTGWDCAEPYRLGRYERPQDTSSNGCPGSGSS